MGIPRVQLARIVLACAIALALAPLSQRIWDAADVRIGWRGIDAPVDVAEVMAGRDSDDLCLWRD